MHTIVIFNNNTKFLPNTCKNQQCTHELSENLRLPRAFVAPKVILPSRLKTNQQLKMDGLKFLSNIPTDSIPVSFFDPQYEVYMKKWQYGNEHTSRNYKRVEIPQMSDTLITKFVTDIFKILMHSGHLFLWLDKFHLCTNFRDWFEDTNLESVDLITWNKKRSSCGIEQDIPVNFYLYYKNYPNVQKEPGQHVTFLMCGMRRFHHKRNTIIQSRLNFNPSLLKM